jgi:single-strand DNA-binding protein
MSLPTVQICGNLKRIETKFTQSGKQVTKFQVECAEKNSKGEYVNLYIAGEVWDNAAAFVNQYFQEGSVAIVTGKLYTNVYENKEGKKVYENKLLFPNVSFAPKDKAGQSNNAQSNQSPQQGNYNGQQQQQSYQANQVPIQYENAQGRPTPPPEIDVDMDTLPF